MLKKILLLLLICSVALSGFAQKSKKKSPPNAQKNSYVEMLINDSNTPADRYCPDDTIWLRFQKLDNTITVKKYCWWDNYHFTDICDSMPIFLIYPLENTYRVSLTLEIEIPTDTLPILDTLVLIADLNIDYIRTVLDTSVCQGRNITVPTKDGNLTYTDVQSEILTPWDRYDRLEYGLDCDSLVRWHIHVDPYIIEEYSISSCDSVIWGDGTNLRSEPPQIIIRRPPDHVGDFDTTVVRVFLADTLSGNCDTMKYLTVTIIDTAQLSIVFDQNAFCDGDDMGGTISLETNFTAFVWRFMGKDSTVFEKSIYIEEPGYYLVIAYMDTSLYDTLKDLRIVSCSPPPEDLTVEDCPLVIPNVITPNGDGVNDVLGIKKLNPVRENELTIYDRWGKNVFHQKNYKCIYKNGKYLNMEDAFAGISRGGKKLPDGTYYYAFKYASFPKSKTYTGTIFIITD